MKPIETRTMKLADLQPAAYNPRLNLKPGDPEYEKLKRSVETFGCVEPIVWNEQTGNIVGGHQRLKVMLDLGMTEEQVVIVDLPPPDEKALNIALNKISGDWDMPRLKELLAELDAEQYDMSLTGYDEDEIAGIMEQYQTGGGSETQTEARSTLLDRFIIPPFSIMDARGGPWSERKAAWKALGIKSELGRGNDGDTTKRGLTFAISSQPPAVYEAKNAYEAKIGRKVPWEEFATLFPEEMKQNGTSTFDPVLCEIIYRWFCPPGGKIIDPFAGGSVRGIVASMTGRDYTGVDLSERQIEANVKNWEELKEIDLAGTIIDTGLEQRDPHWIVGNSMNVQELAPGEYDLFFTCPPYADLEVYSDDPDDISNKEYPQFLELYREIIKQSVAMLKPNRFACVVVGEVRDKRGNYYNFVGDTIAAFRDAGLEYYNEAILIMAYGSLPMRVGKQFTNSRKVGKAHQNVLMFVNGNPDESGVFDYSDRDSAAADVEQYVAANSGKLGKKHSNVLVFTNGDPQKASADIGVPDIADEPSEEEYLLSGPEYG